MPNLAQSLKAEIQRISRKEIKSSLTSIRGSNAALKKTVTGLKKRVGSLEAENRRLLSSHLAIQKQSSAPSPETTGKARITAKSIRLLRTKLGLSQKAFGKLIGVSSQNVLVMEHKEGRLKMRAKTQSNILSIKNIGKREAKKRLEEIEETK